MSVTANYKEMVKAANIGAIIKQYRQVYYNKYFDLFCSRFKVEGFNYRYQKTLRSNLFSKGSVWIRKDAFTGDAICCDYAPCLYDWNNTPVQVQLITKNNAPESIIPTSIQTVDKDGTILFIRPGEKGFQGDVEYFIGKLAEAETLITINLALQRCPWILASDSANYAKLKLFLQQVFSDMLAVITDIDKQDLETIELNTPWLVDKLVSYEDVLEGKLKTLLGIDNQGGHINTQQQNLDTTNSNNDEINSSQDAFLDTLQEGIDRANEVLGLNLRLINKMPKVEQESVSKGLGMTHESNQEEEE